MINEKDLMSIVSTNLKKYMNKQKYTQKELSVKSRLTEVAISRYINGKRLPSTMALLKLAQALEINVSDLVNQNFETD